MLQLSALALDWGANLVETTVFQSFIFGIEGIYPHHHHSTINLSNASALHLFEIYNSTLLNSHIHEKLSPDVSMDSFDVFLRRAEREVTLIHFATEQSTVPHIRRISPDSSLDLLAAKLAFRGHAYIANCSRPSLYGFTDLAKKIENGLNSKVESLHKDDGDKSVSQKKIILYKPFKITRVLCLNPEYTYTSDTLSKYISLPGTAIFTNWLGCCLNECTIHNVKETNDHTLGDHTVGDYSPVSQWPWSHCKTSLRFSVPTRMSYMGRVRDAQVFHHSRIMYAAKRQLEYMGIDQKKGYVSIHIRIERIIRDAAESNFKLWPRNKLNFMEKCVEKILDRLQQLLTLIQAEKQILSKYLLVTDISEYGTNSLTTSTLLNDAQLFLEIFKSHRVQVHHCNLALLSDHDAHNSGYVSLVEMSMLALGQKLLLVGGGGFQMNIAHKFYSLRGRKRDVFKESCDLQ